MSLSGIVRGIFAREGREVLTAVEPFDERARARLRGHEHVAHLELVRRQRFDISAVHGLDLLLTGLRVYAGRLRSGPGQYPQPREFNLERRVRTGGTRGGRLQLLQLEAQSGASRLVTSAVDRPVCWRT